MKRFLLLAVATLAFVGCNNAFEDEDNIRFEQNTLPTLIAGFEDADTRTYVEDNFYLRWHEGDLISAFLGNTLNNKYIFKGETGENSGTFSAVSSAELGSSYPLDNIYAIYPYDENTEMSKAGVISTLLPAEQTYAEDSFGKGANTMVAVTESVNDTFLSFKNVGGYLKIRLYGEGTVKSIELRGNNGEKIAGNANITATYGGVPKIDMADDATESIMLDCGDGVELSADAENPTEFWVVVPPTTFESGITITVTNTDGGVFEQTTTNVVAIERNMIQPMAAIEVEFEVYDPTKPAKNEIWYTSSDDEIVEPYKTDGFGANILSNTYENGKGVITFEGAVTTIGNSAFSWCSSLTSITIPDSVTTIGYEAFYDCESLTSVTIGDSVTTIGDYAFEFCSSLTSVTIPDSVTTIGYNAFSSCWSLTSVTIGDSVTTIGDAAFYDCNSLTSVTIGDSVTTIGDGAFYHCYSLTSVTIGDSVTTIGNSAFSWCSSLTSITIPDSVTTIGGGAFAGCPLIKEFKGKFAADNGRCLIVDDVLISFAIGSGATEYTIPGSVTTIEGMAFYDCGSLTSVTIPDSVTTIGGYAFCDCYSLTSVTIPDSVTTIGDNAFYGCGSLTSVTIGDSVTTIGDYAFCECYSLTSVTIGDSVTTIGDYAFNGCWSLTNVYITDLTTWCNIEFINSSSCPLGFGEKTNLYLNGELLTDLVIPDSVTTIGDYAFEYCSNLTSVTIGDSVTTIGEYAFSGCSSLTSVTIPDSVTTIGNGAFGYCSSLTSVTIPDSVTTIGDYAFEYCSNLTSITIPDSVTTIGDAAFSWCDSLTSITIPDSVTTIGQWAFAYCDSLTSITIPDSVTTIGQWAFAYCDSLTSITIPDSVTTIGDSAFNWCNSLTSVYCKATTPPSIGYGVFNYNASRSKIYVPTASVNDYKTAEGWRNYASYIVGYDF